MIIKGGARAGAASLASHLERADTNERVRVVEMRDVAGATLDQALREMEALASGTRCKSPLYHANIDPRANEVMTAEQWARAVDALEEKLGLQGQPRAVVQHVKEGREHTHVVWSRIDLDHMRAIPDSHNYRKHEEVARALEREFGHARVQGAHAERDGVPRPERTPSQAEMQQSDRSKIDPKAVKAELSALWRQTDTGKAFAAALEDAGYCLARGDKRDFIVVDQAGEAHSLARRIEGAKAKDIRARMADVDPSGRPDAEAAKAIQAARAVARAEQTAEAAPAGDRAAAPESTAAASDTERPADEPAADPEAARLEAQRAELLAIALGNRARQEAEARAERERRDAEARRKAEEKAEARRQRDAARCQKEAEELTRAQLSRASDEARQQRESFRYELAALDDHQAGRAAREAQEDQELDRQRAAEDAARAAPKGLLGRLKSWLNPGAVQKREDEQRKIDARRRNEDARRRQDRREQADTQRRIVLQQQQERQAAAEAARKEREAQERKDLAAHQKHRQDRDMRRAGRDGQDRDDRDGGGRGGRGDDGGRGM